MSMTDFVTRRVQPSKDFPGLIAHSLGEGREVIVIGTGQEAEEILRAELVRRGVLSD
jgi:hypothetical protein